MNLTFIALKMSTVQSVVRLVAGVQGILRSFIHSVTAGGGRQERKLHNEELHKLYASPKVIRLKNSMKRDGWGMWHGWDKLRNAAI
jgi:hypothetical protein